MHISREENYLGISIVPSRRNQQYTSPEDPEQDIQNRFKMDVK